MIEDAGADRLFRLPILDETAQQTAVDLVPGGFAGISDDLLAVVTALTSSEASDPTGAARMLLW